MAEPFETLREVGVAIGGIKEQLNTYARVFAGVVVVGLAVLGFLYSKLDQVEENAARSAGILEQHAIALDRLQTTMDKVLSDTSAIREDIQNASIIRPNDINLNRTDPLRVQEPVIVPFVLRDSAGQLIENLKLPPFESPDEYAITPESSPGILLEKN